MYNFSAKFLFPHGLGIVFIVLGSFALRIFFGLCFSPITGEDEKYIYGLGLSFYTSGDWPYYGPLVLHSGTNIPGALQALLVGLPFYVYPVPEAPFYFLALLMTLSLSVLAGYVCSLGLRLDSRLIWVVTLTLPWTILFGTLVLNVGYALVFAILFMVAFLRRVHSPTVRKEDNPNESNVSNRMVKNMSKTVFFDFAVMGFALVAIIQLHMSWVLLLPFIALAGLMTYRNQSKSLQQRFSFIRVSTVISGGFLVGAAFSGSTLLPTLLRDGFTNTGMEHNVEIVFAHFLKGIDVVRFILSYATYEIDTGYWYAGDMRDRLQFIHTFLFDFPDLLLIPVFLLIHLIGYLQLGVLGFGLWWLGRTGHKNIRNLILFAIVLTVISFVFSNSAPQSYKTLILLPLTVVYSFYVLDALNTVTIRGRSLVFTGKLLGMTLLLVIFLTRVAYYRWVDSDNLYLLHKNREIIREAMDKRDHTIYTHHRNDKAD